jgi:hypothetical protein
MRLRTSRSIITAIVLALGLSATTNVAWGAAQVKRPSRAKLLNFNFRLIAHGWLLATGEDRYLLVTPSFQAPSSAEVIDDTTHQVFGIPVPATGCNAFGLSGSRAVFNCGTRWQPDVRAYSFTENAPQPVPQFSSGCVDGDVTCGAEPLAVGADWIEYQDDAVLSLPRVSKQRLSEP